MPKPDGDNSLTRDKLKLREADVSDLPELTDFAVEIKVSGPSFSVAVQAKGAPWLVRKLLQDMDTSLGQIW